MSKENPATGSLSQTQSQPLTQSQPQTQTQSQPQTQTQTQPSGSSSSSAPGSASQSSSSGTLSSVDTIPVRDLASIPEEPQLQPWGRLLPMEKGFKVHNCVDREYTFGRDVRCHYSFDDPVIKASPWFGTYSKKHFRIFREGAEGTVYLEDTSGNGTFLDGKVVGKGKKLPLANNAELALANRHNTVFVFIDLTADEQANLPRDFSEKYLITKKIGVGACGEVKLAFERSSCKKVAVKTINKKDFPSEGTATRNAEREIEILKKIDHPCLIRTEDFFQTEDSYYIVLEFMEGGELFDRVKTNKQLKEPIAKLYFYQMLKAVQYLHSNGIVHRDLKPENVLLSSHDDVCLVKITDFNQSRVLEEASLMRTLCGTPTYLAPEVFLHATTTGYGPAVDYWSLGVLLFVCLGGYPPFHPDFARLSVRDQITQGVYTFIPSKWDNVSREAKDLIGRLLVVNPSQRLTIDQALQHPWMMDEEMKAVATDIMFPDQSHSPDAMATTATHSPVTMASSSRKRSREEDQEEQPSKRKPGNPNPNPTPPP